MAVENIQSSFRRGVMPLVILSLLKKEDMYGYQLVQETENRSGGKLTTQEGSLYPVLYKLVDQGMISDKRVQVGKRMMRVYYHLEPAGLQRLRELIREYQEITQGIFQIIGEEDCSEVLSAPESLSVADFPATAGQLEAEETDTVPNSGFNPGLCY